MKMAEIILKPITVKTTWPVELASILKKLLYEAIYADLLEVIDEPLTNSKKTTVETYIEKGQIFYDGKILKGKISLLVSKEMKEMGAVWSKKEKGWQITWDKIPSYLQLAIAKENIKNQKTVERLLRNLENIPSKIQQKLAGMDLKKPMDRLYQKIKRDFKGTVIDRLSLLPNISKEQRIYIDDHYVESLVLPIRDKTVADVKAGIAKAVTNFGDDEIIKLRKQIEKHVKNGIPRKSLEKFVNARLKVGKKRARFIARQETSLFTTAFKTAHYQASGIKKYKWRTVGDGAVRHDHERLNGRIFAYDKPPIVDQETGRTGNPGQDYNCRCVDSPIIDF